MTPIKRTILGGIGGVVVALATYPVTVDGYADLIVNKDWAEFVGLALRVAGLFCLGALWAYLHSSQTDPMQAFQLGLVAPAMIAGIVYANVETSSQTASLNLSIISTAHAQTGPNPPSPRPSLGDRIIKGILGK